MPILADNSVVVNDDASDIWTNLHNNPTQYNNNNVVVALVAFWYAGNTMVSLRGLKLGFAKNSHETCRIWLFVK